MKILERYGLFGAGVAVACTFAISFSNNGVVLSACAERCDIASSTVLSIALFCSAFLLALYFFVFASTTGLFAKIAETGTFDAFQDYIRWTLFACVALAFMSACMAILGLGAMSQGTVLVVLSLWIGLSVIAVSQTFYVGYAFFGAMNRYHKARRERAMESYRRREA